MGTARFMFEDCKVLVDSAFEQEYIKELSCIPSLHRHIKLVNDMVSL